ncbi:MAG TPA: DUF1801 domain-containing protein [Chloroflexaceae bacterium]|nr:DUF1801 domain-containing protein [Chloroflexaceae bacterium]
MQSSAPTVDAYLEEVPRERLAAFAELRRLCREHLTGFEKSMRYGMPSYSRKGTVEVGFASQKHNIALYILRKDVLDAHRGTFPASSLGKGCIRFRNPAQLDFPVIVALLRETVTTIGEICP